MINNIITERRCKRLYIYIFFFFSVDMSTVVSTEKIRFIRGGVVCCRSGGKNLPRGGDCANPSVRKTKMQIGRTFPAVPLLTSPYTVSVSESADQNI